MSITVSIAGASGYVGGELVRLLLAHPDVEIGQVTSERHRGSFIHKAHPNLRGFTDLKFSSLEDLDDCDVLIAALPHGQAARRMDGWSARAHRVIDCSADFRLRDGAAYQRWYGHEHPAPMWLDRFIYGLPELNREAIEGARWVSGVGCNATAVNMAVLPLVLAGLVDHDRGIIAEVKAGSSEGGNGSTDASHHPERSGVVRSFAPVGHRHTSEIVAATNVHDIHLSVTSVEMVRGALATCHLFSPSAVTEKDLWRAYRGFASEQPFVRVVHERSGMHRHPEPKLLAGSNLVDIGWSLDESSGRIVALAAIDNLGKGAAGSAVQCLNLMCGLEETRGLGFPGLHPV